MLEVLYATGIRRAELAGLDVADVNLAKQTLFVREGKGARDRIVPLGERATVWVTRYLADTRPALVDPSDVNEPALFVTERRHPDLPRACRHDRRRLPPRQPGSTTAGVIVFRHTVATLMFEGGADVRWVQAMLGHRSIISTQIYTHVDITPLAAVHAATHPGTSNQPRHRRPPPDRPVVVPLRHPAHPTGPNP